MDGQLHRSELTVPGVNLRALAKAASLGADIVCLDLEDSVAPTEKELARENVIAALREQDWSSCRVGVRINSLDTPWSEQDVIQVMGRAGGRVDLLVIPKVTGPFDVELVSDLCQRIEEHEGLPAVKLSAMIETASGLVHVEEIARSCQGRLEALVFGPKDFAAAMRADPTASAHLGSYALVRMIIACRASGLSPIDGPFTDLGDDDGLLSSSKHAAALGCDGKWVVHPSQIPIVNAAFSPTEQAVSQARRVLRALEDAAEEGKGVLTLDGRMVDAASIRMAQVTIGRAEAIRERDHQGP